MNVVALVDQGMGVGMLQHREEALMLASFLAAQRPRGVMEIGSWKGGTFLVLCGLSCPSSPKISIDLNAYGDLACTMEERNAMMRSWSPKVRCVVGDSHIPGTQEAARAMLGDARLDFLLIDGDHSYDGCKADYLMYGPMVSDQGWIAFHDINDTPKHRASGCMVSQVWSEVRGEKVEISLGREWGGIGLVRHG
jgi:cephalosporin hydroxylase